MDLRRAPAELRRNILGQTFGVAAGHIDVEIFICFQLIEHIINRDLEISVFLVDHFRGKLHFVDKKVKLRLRCACYDAFHILAQHDRITVFIISALIQFNPDNFIFRDTVTA